MAKTVLGKVDKKKLCLVPLSKGINQSKISHLSSDILDQVIADIEASPLKVSFWRVISDIFYYKKKIKLV